MEDLLQCPICCLDYDNTSRTPRQLPCQHNLCSQCLPHLRKSNPNQPAYIECPICREKFTREINDIPKSLVIVQLIDAKLGTSHSAAPVAANNSNNMSAGARVPPPPNYYPGTSNPGNSNNNWGQARQPPSPYYQPTPTNNYYPNPYGNAAGPMFYPQAPPPPYFHNPPPQKPSPPRPPQQTSNNNNNNNNSNNNNQSWNFRNYLRGIFNEIDINRDGSITANELQSALRRCQSTQFDMKTIELLIAKYDANMDFEISFDEFYDLFNNLNEEYETFLLTDADGSGFIDLNEFTEALKAKGYFFSRSFYEFIVNKICKKTRTSGIQFDIYIRVAARFDKLCTQYNYTLNYQKNSLENYLKDNFFDDFW